MTDLLEQRIRESLARVADRTPVPPRPEPAPAAVPTSQPSPRRWRRAAVVGGSAAVLAASGVGVAVATGVMDAHLAFWNVPDANTGSATVLGEFTAPGGSTVRAEIASASGGRECVAFRVLPRSSVRPPNPNDGVVCGTWTTATFGKDGGASGWEPTGGQTYWLFVRSAGAATDAVITTGATHRHLLVRDGWILGWADANRPTTVTGYDASGRLIGDFDLPQNPRPQAP